MATMTAQGTLPVAGGDINAEPLTDTLNHIMTTYNGNNADENNVDYTSTDGIMVLAQAQTSTGAKVFAVTTLWTASTVVTGLQIRHDPVSGTANDTMGIEVRFQGDNDAATPETIDYASLQARFTDTTDGTEDGELSATLMVDGTETEVLRLASGLTTTGSVLTLKTGETTVVDGDVLGKIQFQAPLEASGTDAILVAASIWAEADDTFAADNNDADLVFGVAESETAQERMRLAWDGATTNLHFAQVVNISSTADITLTAVGDVNLPANIGLTFGDDGEKIEGDGTDLTIAGNNIKLTATADVVIPANVGITFGSGEKIEGNDTDLTITSGADIALTATADVNIPANVGVTFGNDVEKIEGDGTDLTIAGNIINLTPAASVNVTAGTMYIGDTSNAKITVGLTINQGAADDSILGLKSSDVAHPFTDYEEADTYGAFGKGPDVTIGGLLVRGLADGNNSAGYGLTLDGFVGKAVDTTKSTAGIGAILLRGYTTNGGTSAQALGADGNVAVIQNAGTTRFIFDGEGSGHADVEWVAFEAEDDFQLVKDVESAFVPELFGQAVKYHEADLERLGLFHDIRREGDKMRGMMNYTRMTMFHHGTLHKLIRVVQDQADEILALRGELKALTA